jgi:hypothetical protein
MPILVLDLFITKLEYASLRHLFLMEMQAITSDLMGLMAPQLVTTKTRQQSF